MVGSIFGPPHLMETTIRSMDQRPRSTRYGSESVEGLSKGRAFWETAMWLLSGSSILTESPGFSDRIWF